MVLSLDSLQVHLPFRLHRAHLLAGRRKLFAVVRLRKFLGFGVVSWCFDTLAGGFLCLCSAGVQWSEALELMGTQWTAFSTTTSLGGTWFFFLE